jgi:DnaK suppressor protein
VSLAASARPASSISDTDQTSIRSMLDEHRNARLDQIKALTFTDPHDSELDPQSRRRALLAAELTVGEIDEALLRLQDGSYGACLGCGAPIVPERLFTVPYTRHCTACASRA